jgi:hypothetical protein
LGGQLDAGSQSITSSTTNINLFNTISGYVCNIRNSHASTPEGILIFFNSAAPDDNTERFINCIDSSATRAICYSDGDWVNHDNSYGAISDERLKQDIRDCNSQWEDIKRLPIKKYKMKSDVLAYNDEAKEQIGVVAQEVKKAGMDGLVQYHKKEEEYSVQYSVLYMKAVKALQEALIRIEALEQKLDDKKDRK